MFDDLDHVFVTVDPQLGPIAIGYDESVPAICGWDMRGGKPLWEALTNNEDIGDLELGNIGVHGHNVYLALGGMLFCLDLATGSTKWSRALANTPDETEFGIALADPFPVHGRGAILVQAGDKHWLYALDRETGNVLWERQYSEYVEIASSEGQGTCVVSCDFVRVEIIDPASPTPIKTLHTSFDLLKPVNGVVMTIQVDSVTNEQGGRNGILAFDAQTGEERFFDPVEDIETAERPCAIDEHIFAIREGEKGIYVGPQGRHLPSPIAGTLVGELIAANHTLGVLVYADDGDAVRRFVGLDPATLALKFDLGAIGEADDDEYENHVRTDNSSFVVLVVPDDDMKLAELRSVDAATGHPLWTAKSPKWEKHDFVGGLLVVRREGVIDVLFPATGQLVATLNAAN